MREYLRRGDARQAVDLYRRRPGRWIWDALNGEGLEPTATGELLRRLLPDNALLVLHHACRTAADLARH
ncbi:hypothetical protein [Streptosporangium sp. NPDC051022]|uniref:hypothetical protein n=1 Tax=Streptosporangium sp. NPDC051022 TaxID=3155752 RepID=UPI00342FDFC8